jgi:hypothetical protein
MLQAVARADRFENLDLFRGVDRFKVETLVHEVPTVSEPGLGPCFFKSKGIDFDSGESYVHNPQIWS